MKSQGLTTSIARAAAMVIASLALGFAWLGWHARADQPSEQESISKAAKHDEPQLALSRCNECHASTVEGTPAWQHSSLVWFDRDPHAQAYTKLLNAQSQRIVDRLMGTPMAVDTPEYRQVLRDRCVSCHANEQASDPQIKLGVECQVCHGPASAWGEEHYSQATLALGSQRFANSQRVNLESMEQRARVCSACHVGQLNRGPGLQDREVDHRLMAAGHPMMYFDFENYLERYPKHWDVVAEEARLGAFPAYSRWQLGKWITAQVRLVMLRDRATRVESTLTAGASTGRDWPEFTEYSCTSCHYPLLSESWRQRVRSSKSTTWDEWYLERVEQLFSRTTDDRITQSWHTASSALRSNMENRRPDPSAAKTHAQSMIDLCQMAIDAPAPPDAKRIREQLRQLLDEESKVTSWEQGAQWVTTARMLSHSLGWEQPDSPIEGSPPGGFFRPPRPWDPIATSPAFQGADWFRPDALRKYRESLQQRLGTQP
jgi:hypothetical protein